nr:immunoglobulin light chain junction region [Macaca mulatta]
CRHYYSAPHSF